MVSLEAYTRVVRKPQIRRTGKQDRVPDMNRVAAIVLSGGEGTRLYPLTLNRCKPALCFGGRYKLIDIPISNSINSGCNKILFVTQFLSASLHQHIFNTYRPDNFNTGFLRILAAEQKPSKQDWFKGTADAVRQNIEYIQELPVDYFLILSGDQLYSMDYSEMLQTAIKTDADVVVAALPVGVDDCKRMGILKTDERSKIIDFIEKPKDLSVIEHMKLSPGATENDSQMYLGSMGIYLFKRDALLDLLKEDLREDFGKHLIPTMMENGKAAAYIFEGYWEDIGTIESFYRANIALTAKEPLLDCYDEVNPIHTTRNNLMGPKIFNTLVNQSILCEGCIVEADEISHSILGPRTVVKKGTIITSSYIMGHDYYNSPAKTSTLPEELHIGKNCIITKSIIDKNVYIGDNVRLINKNNLSHYDGNNIYIRDGIIIVPRGATISDGFVL
jgi:glucose-1-phosphate adenylyltransferase